MKLILGYICHNVLCSQDNITLGSTHHQLVGPKSLAHWPNRLALFDGVLKMFEFWCFHREHALKCATGLFTSFILLLSQFLCVCLTPRGAGACYPARPYCWKDLRGSICPKQGEDAISQNSKSYGVALRIY